MIKTTATCDFCTKSKVIKPDPQSLVYTPVGWQRIGPDLACIQCFLVYRKEHRKLVKDLKQQLQHNKK